MNENCFLDFNNEIKIPQNKINFFIIEKSNDWANSIDIKIKIKEEIDFLNLFLIIKSFVNNIEFFCFKITTIIIKEDQDLIVTENLFLNHFSKINYWEFEKWMIEKISIDLKYIEDDKNFYGLRIIFSKDIINSLNKKYNCEVLNFLKPKFPWEKRILEETKTNNFVKIDELETIKKKIENKEPSTNIIDYINKLIKK